VPLSASSTRVAEPLLASGADMCRWIAELYPICRSITGDGVRETLRRLNDLVPLEIHEVPSGTPVFDWTVPREWNIRDAWVKDASGRRVIDFQHSNLHVVNYSIPVRCRMTLAELRPHLHSLPDHPSWIPYRTSYYNETWGFCLAHRDLEALRDEEYEVCIDATLQDGSLSYGEIVLEGTTAKEILISCHICHPSLCNDNLSGIAVSAALARELQAKPHRYTYRFLFIPGTIGAITWLALHQGSVRRINGGLVLAGIGDTAPLAYKKSRLGDSEIDRTVEHVLRHSGLPYLVTEFSPYGYDERQYCSPGFNLPVGRLSRSPHGQFPEYHTSADDLTFVSQESLAASLQTCRDIISVLEDNHSFVNLNANCEPQLGKRGLYRAIGGNADAGKSELAMLWTLSLSDGRHSLLDIAERSGLHFASIRDAARLLLEHGLLQQQIGEGGTESTQKT